MNKFWDFYSQL